MEVDSWINGLPSGSGALPWVAMAGTAALAASPLGRRVFSAAGNTLEKISRNSAVAVMGVGLFAFAVTAAISVLVYFSETGGRDGFCFVLTRGSVAPGRLGHAHTSRWGLFDVVY